MAIANWSFGVLCLWVLGGASPCFADTQEKTLDNGLKVVVKTDRRAPVVVSQLWYRVGSIDEVNTVTGVSHALEHMMFKGTPTVPEGEFSRRVAAMGGKENAFTSQDYTVYFQQLSAKRLPEAFALEADRMAHLSLDASAFSKEIQVIREERRMRTDDQPFSVLHERLNATAMLFDPARQPVIGWDRDLQRMQVSDLRAWYESWYSPKNATLVVVGDVVPEQVFSMAEATFGRVASRPVVVRQHVVEPDQGLGVKRLTVKQPSELGLLSLAWRAPHLTRIDEKDPYALFMLAGILDGLDASRLPKTLVREKKLATSVSASYDFLGRGATLFSISAIPAQGVSAAKMEAALRHELDRIVKEGVGEMELARVRTQLAASHIFEKDSMFAQAMSMGRLESLGFSWRDEGAIQGQLNAVRSEDIQRVARQYLQDDHLTVGVLVPQPTSPAKAASNAASVGMGGGYVR